MSTSILRRDLGALISSVKFPTPYILSTQGLCQRYCLGRNIPKLLGCDYVPQTNNRVSNVNSINIFCKIQWPFRSCKCMGDIMLHKPTAGCEILTLILVGFISFYCNISNGKMCALLGFARTFNSHMCLSGILQLKPTVGCRMWTSILGEAAIKIQKAQYMPLWD